MSNLNTSYVTVFPAVRRVNQQLNSRLFTEKSLVNIINKLIDKEGFIITPFTNDFNTALDFNIHGYFFSVRKIQDIIDLAQPSDTALYAYIKVVTDNDYTELYGQDDNGVYQGLNIGSVVPSPGSGEQIFKLKLLDKSSGSWKLCLESYFKFGTTSIEKIDGGNIL